MNDIDKTLAKIDKDIEYHKSIVREHNKIVGKLLDNKNRILRNKSAENIVIKDHAILQYLIRVGTPGINPDRFREEIDELKQKMLEDKKETIMKCDGEGSFIYQGIKFVVRDYNVITVIDINK